jgi:hypothetical protein
MFHCWRPIYVSRTKKLTVEGIITKTKVSEIKRDNKGKVIKTQPTHTIMFKKFGTQELLMTYSVSHSNVDVFCKTEGKRIAEDRMKKLEKIMDGGSDAGFSIFGGDIHITLPHKVIKTLNYYVNCAKKYYKISGEVELILLPTNTFHNLFDFLTLII